MKNILDRIIWTKWKIARTYWPYAPGYGTYKKNRFNGRKVILDTGLTKEGAIASIKQLNKKH